MRRLILIAALLAMAACAAPRPISPERDGGIGGTGAPDL